MILPRSRCYQKSQLFDFCDDYNAGKGRATWLGRRSRRCRAELVKFLHRSQISQRAVVIVVAMIFFLSLTAVGLAIYFGMTTGVDPENEALLLHLEERHNIRDSEKTDSNIPINDPSPKHPRNPQPPKISTLKRNFGLDSNPKGNHENSAMSDGDRNWDAIWEVIEGLDVLDPRGTQKDSLSELQHKSKRIKSAFLHAWDGYATVLGHDSIHPVTGKVDDSWGHLGASLVDALDTLLLMNLHDHYETALDVLKTIDFTIDLKASFFETTIRCLGGLIASFEMTGDEMLLHSAHTLGDRLFRAFATRHGVPMSMVNLESGHIENYGWTGGMSILAEIGTNQLEFYSLSELTHDPKYRATSSRVFEVLDAANQQSPGEFPRAIHQEISAGSIHGNQGTYSWGGMSDSFYEYLLKVWILSNYKDPIALKLYVESVDAAKEKLLRKVTDLNRREEPYFFLGEQNGGRFHGKMEELQCFIPGVLSLGAFHANLRREQSENGGAPLNEYEQRLVEEREQHLKLAHVLVESCVAMFRESETGLAPESITFDDHHWRGQEMKYQLRPETIESLFILHSLTGNQLYRAWGWQIFESIQRHCRTEIAYSGVVDVSQVPPRLDDQMQSYFLAETFKYLYLLFNDQAANKVPLDQFVFNTEAHPMRILK